MLVALPFQADTAQIILFEDAKQLSEILNVDYRILPISTMHDAIEK